MKISRRNFIINVGAAAIAVPLVSSPFFSFSRNPLNEPLDIHLFSKHLQFLTIKDAAQIAAELGFNGLDLTVRPNGHVVPEQVKIHLPEAIQDIKNAGISCKMITTTVSDVANPLDVDVIQTAAAEGVKFYRSDWFTYKEDQSFIESLDYYKEKIRQLAEFNKMQNITGCYQNHSGTTIGASIWEVYKILETADPKFFGAQYDIRHAMAEGGQSWPNGVKLLKDHIKTIVLKDFKWGVVDGKWQIIDVPIGEGMVDFNAYFKLLKSFDLMPPVSLHLEYPLGGADKGNYEITVDKKVVFDAMRKDLIAIQQLWKDA